MPEQNIEMLIEFTKDEDPQARALSIMGLAKLGDPRGFAPVVVALFDPVEEVRLSAALALGLMRDERAFEPLEACLTDSSEQVAAACASAMTRLPQQKATQRVIALIQDESYPVEVRTLGISSLGDSTQLPNNCIDGNEQLTIQLREALVALSANADTDIRAAAVYSLGHLLPTQESISIYLAALNDNEEVVVSYAIEALANSGAKEAIIPLKALAEKESGEIADLANRAIERLS